MRRGKAIAAGLAALAWGAGALTHASPGYAAASAPPAASTGDAGAVGQNAATLTGTLDTQGFETTYEFDLGTDTSYGTRIFGDAGSEPGGQDFAVPLQGLAPGTTYHFRIVATNFAGTTYGADQTFTTTSYPTALLAAPASAPLVPAPLLMPEHAGASASTTATASVARVTGHGVPSSRRKNKPDKRRRAAHGRFAGRSLTDRKGGR